MSICAELLKDAQVPGLRLLDGIVVRLPARYVGAAGRVPTEGRLWEPAAAVVLACTRAAAGR